VERLICIFQALNPADFKSWPNDPWISKTVEPWFENVSETDDAGTWTIPHGTRERSTTPLAPFSKDERGTIWTSDGCRSFKDLGYSFEELQDWLPKYNTDGKFNEPLFVADVRQSLIDKYGWALPRIAQLRRLAQVPQGTVRSQAESHAQGALASAESKVSGLASQAKQAVLGHKSTEHKSTEHERQFNEYVINVRVDRYVLSLRATFPSV
jgi:tyrosinase